ncbi:MAG: DUF4126 domain-containing protein, partial [Gammaproteobacteria bacterium]
MEEYQQIAAILSLSMGAAWASGINLYAALVMIGLMGATGNLVVPEQLEVLTNPLVIGAAGFMYMVEFVADKMPGVDTGWDSLHTFIRIPAGAMLAAGAVGELSPGVELAAAIVGGGVATTSHLTKAGSRVLINTSPEPVTNWVASIGEDVLVLAGLWAALTNPWLFLVLLIGFLLLAVWFIPKLWRGIKTVFRGLGRLFGRASIPEPPLTGGQDDWQDVSAAVDPGNL